MQKMLSRLKCLLHLNRSDKTVSASENCTVVGDLRVGLGKEKIWEHLRRRNNLGLFSCDEHHT